jgi:hypothetical protein
VAGECDVLTRTEHSARVQNPDTRIFHKRPTYICCILNVVSCQPVNDASRHFTAAASLFISVIINNC